MIRIALLALLAFTGCEAPKACSTIAMASVSLTIQDENGAAVPGVIATYDAGDGPVACESLTSTGFFCGMEVAGTLAIHVEAPGFADFDQSVDVGMTEDQCHVAGEDITAVLVAADCTAEAVPAVIATVAGSSGESLEQVEVDWGLANADMMPQPCDPQTDGSWVCAPEQIGNLEIYASAAGHVPEMRPVLVALDEAGCHPVTQSVEFTLDWAPD